MAKLTNSAGAPVGGVVPYPVTALVTDNVDPDELARIKVKFTTLPDEPLSFWIRQISPNAGKERGLYALPEKDDEVLVIFMNGSQDVGVIIGQFWNGKDKPPKEAKDGMPGSGAQWTGDWSSDTFTDGTTDLKKNDRRFWRSRFGHLIAMDDSKGKETVQIWDGKHNLSLVFDTKENRITLVNNKGDIHIRCKKDLYLEAGGAMKVKVKKDWDTEVGGSTTWIAGKDISTEAKKGKSEHKAKKDYKIESSTGKFDAKAKTGAKVDGTVKAEFTATKVDIKGKASVTIKGGTVSIN